MLIVLQVLENIVCYSQRKRSDATRPSRSTRRLAERIREVELANPDSEVARMHIRRMAHDEYDVFAQEPPRKAPKPFDELDSAGITRLCSEGLVFWLNDEEDIHMDAYPETGELNINMDSLSQPDDATTMSAFTSLGQHEAPHPTEDDLQVLTTDVSSLPVDARHSAAVATEPVTADNDEPKEGHSEDRDADAELPSWTVLSPSLAEVDELL